MGINDQNNFLFSPTYRVWRHITFWIAHGFFICCLWSSNPLYENLYASAVWLPAWMLYCYPLMYWIIPKYLLKGKYLQFTLIIIIWGVAGFFWNALFRWSVFIPALEYMNFPKINRNPWQQGNFVALTATAGVTSMIILCKHWAKKQREWLQAEKEKISAELQLLKAQVHPQFLFNTLNNIYTFSLTKSPKTPQLILKLSSILSYMLYDCKAEQVLLEKELEVMKDYVDLEKERYGNQMEISWNIEGDLEDRYIVPLLLLPFLENAFKYGTSEQIEKPWLSFDLVIKQNTIKCKIANSKNELVPVTIHGIGIENVKKRLDFLYPGKHELKINDEGDFFVVSLLLELSNYKVAAIASPVLKTAIEKAAI